MNCKLLHNITHPTTPPMKICLAESFFQRFLGLMGKKSLQENTGVLFVNPRSSIIDAAIHMLFMRFDIAVIWMDSSFKVVDKVLAKKWHLNYAPKIPARYILETDLAYIDKFEIGDQVTLA